jgi:hypothetical protein
MGTEASKPLKPLAPPVNWEQNNQYQLQIISPTNNDNDNNGDGTGAVSNNFRIISPSSDISNPSDVWRLQHPMTDVQVHNEKSRRQRSRNSSLRFFNHSSNHSFGKENSSNKRQSSGMGKRGFKKCHNRRMGGSLTKVFGCFVESPRTQEEPEYGETPRRRNLVEI